MAYLSAFDHFHPLTGVLPVGLASLFGTTIERAHQILSNRNSYIEIAYGLESLDWILEKGSEVIRKNAMRSVEPSQRERYYSSDPRLLSLYMDYFDIADQPSLPHATWPEYFAILAISFAGEAVNVVLSTSDTYLSESQAQIQKAGWVSDLAIDAEDAIDLAENFLVGNDLAKNHELFQDRISNLHGREKVSKYDELRSRVISVYEQHYRDQNGRDASKRIWHQLDSDAKAVLVSREPEKKIEHWIGQYRRANKFS